MIRPRAIATVATASLLGGVVALHDVLTRAEPTALVAVLAWCALAMLAGVAYGVALANWWHQRKAPR